MTGFEPDTAAPRGGAGAPQTTPRLAWLLSLARPLRHRIGDVALALAVLLYALAYRLLRLEPVEIGGDAVNKWHFARQWFHDFDVANVTWNHHLSRLGVNVPIALVQLLLGRDAVVYYAVSVGVFGCVAVLTFVIGRLAHGRAAGLLACVWFVTFPSWNRTGSQITPEAFGALYVGFAMLFLLIYERSERRRLFWLCASSVSAALAYLAKEPFAAFVGGGMVATFFIGRSYRHAALYGAIPIGVLALETLFYRLVSPYSSRFGLVSSTHGSAVIDTIFDVFKRYTTLSSAWKVLLATALLAVFALPFLVRSRRVWPLIWLPVSFFGFCTFALKSLNPLALWTRFLSRYLDVGVPFAALLAACLVVSVAGLVVRSAFRLASRWRRAAGVVTTLRSLERAGAAAGCLVLLALGARTYSKHAPTSKHPLVVTQKLERQLTDAYRRRLPIVSSSGRPGRRMLALKAAYKFYIDDRALVEDGKLPSWNPAQIAGHRLVRPGGPAPRRGCSIQLGTAGRFLTYRSLKPLPKSCDEPARTSSLPAEPAPREPAPPVATAPEASPVEPDEAELEAEIEAELELESPVEPDAGAAPREKEPP